MDRPAVRAALGVTESERIVLNTPLGHAAETP
jgi:hypothetical protein